MQKPLLPHSLQLTGPNPSVAHSGLGEFKAVLRSLQLIFPKQFHSSCSFFSLSLSSTQHGCISKDDYWIACRVLLSRVRSLDDFLTIRMPDRTALSKPRPQYLRSAYNNFQRCEQQTFAQLCNVTGKVSIYSAAAACATAYVRFNAASSWERKLYQR